MTKLLLLMVGGAIGSAGRYFLSGFTHRLFEPTFPYGTLMVNLLGSAIIGFIWGLWESGNLSTNVRSFVFIGLLGGFTTFSTFMLESMNLIRDGEYRLGLINLLIHNVGGVVAVFAAFYLARFLTQLLR